MPFIRIPFSLTLALLGALLLSADAGAQDDPRGAIEGHVVDAETGETLLGAAVRIRELGRGQATVGDGSFAFDHLHPRSYTVAAQFLGYLPLEKRVQVPAGQTVSITLELEPSQLELAGVVVTDMGRERGVADTYRPTAAVSGRELDRALETSVAETLRRVPGLHPVYNGPAASRPTIRGMGGDRVVILEDGQQVGDLSTTAADHAVASDPISAERIEVVRGPAGLLYGSNALGGVVNVVRGEIPRTRPTTVSGTFTSNFASVNRGAGGHLLLTAPLGPFSLRAEGSARSAGDTHTALGTLPSTGLATYSGGVGLSVTPSWGFAGLAYRYYDSAYGVPGMFQGEVIPGAHPDGVDIEMNRHVLRAQAAYFDGLSIFDSIELDANLTHYQHQEIEGFGPEGAAWVGAQFDQLSGGASLMARHGHDLDAFSTEGAIGVSANARDLIAGGGFSGTRSATEFRAAAFIFEEFSRGRASIQVGGRLDHRRVSPADLSPILTSGGTIPVRERSFSDISASAALLYEVHPGWTTGLSLSRAFRSPTVEELFSDGPHLADFSYDIGNPELGSEIGHGADLFVRATRSRYTLELGGFANRVSNFIYYRPTGDIDQRFGRFPVFQAASDDALFLGFEARAQVEVARGLLLDGQASYVRASRLSDGDPLPAIPPLTGGLDVRYESPAFFVSLGVEAASGQNRVPGRIDSPIEPGEMITLERPTSGYGLLNASAGYRFDFRGMHHAITLQGRNLTNEAWRDHLSRIKDVAPQPGRSIQLTYRVQF